MSANRKYIEKIQMVLYIQTMTSLYNSNHKPSCTCSKRCLYIRFTWRLKNDGYKLCVLTDSLFEHKRVIVKLFSVQQG